MCSRRWVCVLLVLFLVIASGFGFGLKEIVPGEYYNLSDYEKLTNKKITKFNEAPMLAELVKQGKLPLVQERLPKNPVVVVPFEEIGQYGGTWRRVWYGLSDWWGPSKLSYEFLVALTKDGGKFLPSVFENVEISPDGRVFKFKIREGLKWSDGTPVTTDDVKFWYEDVLLNEKLTPSIPSSFKTKGEVFKLRILDKYNFEVTFSEPYPLFLYELAREYGVAGIYFVVPSHYIKQFHPKYVGEAKAQEIAKANGFENWWQFISSRCLSNTAWLTNPDLPVLYAWKLSRRTTDTVLVLERNPYYFKIDPVGNQLPYIDEIVHYLVQDSQMVVYKAITGEIDMQARNIPGSELQVLLANREKGGYRILFSKLAIGSDVTLYFDQNYKGDPFIRDLLRNPKFRQAVSLAINREELWQLVYQGLGEPRQASLIKGVKYYDPEWEKAYAEYDPKKASQLLDEIGLNKKDKEGFRLRPDGQRLEIVMEYPTIYSYWDQAFEMIKSYLEKVGIKVALKPIERTLYEVRYTSGEMQVAAWSFDRNSLAIADPSHLLGRYFAPLNYLWYTSGGKSGEAPEENSDLRKLYELYDKVKTEVDENKRDEYMRQIIELHKKNLWIVGTVGASPAVMVVKNNFRNVPEGLVWDHPLMSPKNLRPEQFFFKK